MELWGWIACVFAGQVIGIALCILPRPVTARVGSYYGPIAPDVDPLLGTAAMWSDAPALRDRTAA